MRDFARQPFDWRNLRFTMPRNASLPLDAPGIVSLGAGAAGRTARTVRHIEWSELLYRVLLGNFRKLCGRSRRTTLLSARRRRLTRDKESNRWPYCCEVWTKYCSRGALWAGGVTGPCRGGLDKGGPSWGCGGSWPGVRRIPIPARIQHVSSGPGVSMGRVQGAVGVRGVGGDEMRRLEPASRR